MRTHAANPVPEHRGGDLFRVYFGGRDAANRTSIGWVDIELRADAARVVRVADEPVLGPGPAGAFDDSGTSVGCLVADGGRTLLYYLGWNLGVTAPWRNAIGLAVRDRPDGPFARYSAGPILDRSPADPYTLSYPCVLRDRAGWRMWYGSNLSWGAAEADMRHVIKAAASADGIAWDRDGAVAVGFAGPADCALCRPWVVRDGPVWRMWYAHRGGRYRIGYAESADGRRWERQDHRAGIDVTPGGWDGEMVCYPCVFDHAGGRYMLYNGDGYGRTGFGLAVLEQD
jgi:hypothetical protein